MPVVFVLYDELPIASLMDQAGHVDQHLFPHFAQLEHTSTWFRNTTTVATFSEAAIPALLTSQYPTDENSPSPPGSTNLFALMGTSYKLFTHEDVGDYCSGRRCTTIPGGPAKLGRHFGSFREDPRGLNYASFLHLLNEGRGPRFYFLHIVVPHSPWRYLPSGRLYAESDPEPGEVDPPGARKEWAPISWLAKQAYQRHLLQTQLVDRLLGALVHRMKHVGIFSKSLLVVAADHGIGFEPGYPKRVITTKTVGHLAAVPFFMKKPGQHEGRVSDAPVELVDLVPTIADALRIEVPRGVDGSSALRPASLNHNRSVGEVQLDLLGREKFAVVREKYETFGSDGEGLDLFKLAPGNLEKFIGRRPASLSIEAESPAAAATVPALASIESASHDSDPFPALLDGMLSGVAPGSSLAIAVNGRVAAFSRAWADGGGVRFTAMLSPRFFSDAPNNLRVFLVENAGARLVPIGLSGT